MKSAILILGLMLTNASLAQDSPADVLRKGITQEEVDRDLKAAIKTYGTVAARAKQDRQAAATAVFRMAGCYGLLGQNMEAFMAYMRVANDFADQEKLAEDSRIRMTDIARESANRPVPANEAEAQNIFRGRLENALSITRAYLNYMNQQVSLGAIGETDTYDVQATVARLQAQLAAYDAGLFPKQPSSPPTPQAQKAREDYRKSLATAMEFAVKSYLAALANYKLGKNQQRDVLRASHNLADIDAQLAAFDAGLVYTPLAGALAP